MKCVCGSLHQHSSNFLYFTSLYAGHKNSACASTDHEDELLCVNSVHAIAIVFKHRAQTNFTQSHSTVLCAIVIDCDCSHAFN